jgi:ketosteroid isomerase-like protein
VTSNEARATTLARALRAGLARDRAALVDCYTDDVCAWTPTLATETLAELVEELPRLDDAFSDIELAVAPLDVGGDYAGVEWSVAMTHTGAFVPADDTRLEPTGLRVIIHGVTVAEFRGERICSLRQYWDELELLRQLGRDS